MFFVMMIMFFVVMRFAVHGNRGHCGRLHYQHHHRRPMRIETNSPSAFERLKQRYVNGDLSDEQYEEEVDALLRSPRTRESVP